MIRANSVPGHMCHFSTSSEVRRSSAAFSPRSAAEGSVHMLRRSRSETELITRTAYRKERVVVAAAAALPATVAEEEEEDEDETILETGSTNGRRTSADVAAVVEMEHLGGGMGNDGKMGGWRSSGDDGGQNRQIGEHYRRMLRIDPGNPLLLRNYATYLCEVERDVKAAEEFYGRAMLVGAPDGELLSMYGKVLWETSKDAERAESYFERAIEASPDDCYVLGSYARFLWDADEEDGEKTTESPPLIESF